MENLARFKISRVMKSRIFIGSSSEGLNVVSIIKDFFEPDYECVVWNEDVFKENENFLETLLKSASLFDFGFMVFTADDFLEKRKEFFSVARDNVLFEYGLFLGRLGANKAFVLQEKGTELPSDLLGITISQFNTKEEDGKKILDEENLREVLKKLKKRIDENVRLGYLGMLPSTVVAISYFENFVKLVSDWIKDKEPEIEIKNVSYRSAKLKIIIPSNLDADLKKRATMFYKKNGLEDSAMETVHRSFPIHVSVSGNGEELVIYDMPTILNGIDKAIDMYFRVGHIGKTAEQNLTEIRELNNFERVLALLIEQDAFCKDCVQIEKEKD